MQTMTRPQQQTGHRIDVADPAASLAGLPEICGCGDAVDAHRWIFIELGMIAYCDREHY